MCGKCWHQNLEELEKANNRFPEPIGAPDYESGGQEFESLRARQDLGLKDVGPKSAGITAGLTGAVN
jgi:hypothetical protein